MFGDRAPAVSPNVNSGCWIKKWFENEQAYGLRLAAERFLDTWAVDEDIPAVQEVRQGESGLQAASLDCKIVGVGLRQSLAEGFAELRKRNPEQISAELQGVLPP